MLLLYGLVVVVVIPEQSLGNSGKQAIDEKGARQSLR